MKTTKINIKKWQILCLIFFVINITACGDSGSNSDDSNNNDNTDNLIGVGFNKARGFNDEVLSIVLDVDGSGSMYVGGGFTTYNNTQVRHLVRLKPDGTVDENFITGTGFTGIGAGVASIVQTTDGSGDIYVAGRFDDYNGNSVNDIVRLNSNGSIDTGFTVNAADLFSFLRDIILAPDNSGDIYAAFAGGMRRFNPDGSLDTAFNTGTGFISNDIGSAPIHLLATADGSGDVYVAGDFSSYNGTLVNDLIRLDTRGVIATDSTGKVKFSALAGLAGSSSKMILADDGNAIYVGGSFASYNNEPAKNLIKLNADGSIAPEFTSNGFNRRIRNLALAADGTDALYVGGGFTSYNGKTANGFLRINADGTEDVTFITGLAFDFGNNFTHIDSIAVTTSGDIYAGGSFANYNGTAQNNLTRINTDGTVDTAFTVGIGSGFDEEISNIVAATDNSNGLYVSGPFTSYNGITANGLVRLNSDGTVDAEFVTGSGFEPLNFDFRSKLVLTQNNTGDIYVTGTFKSYNGNAVNSIIRLNPDGTIDTEFNTGSGFVRASETQPVTMATTNDGSDTLYVSGNFTSYNGIEVNNLVRLNADGTIDSDFDTGTGFNGGISSLILTTDGSNDLYVAGSFSDYNGKPVDNLVRLNKNGELDTEFNIDAGFNIDVGFTASLFRLSADGSGDIYVTGSFTTDNGKRDLVRLNADGTIDTDFNTGGAFIFSKAGSIRTLLPATDGDVYIGGDFDFYKGVASKGLVRLNANGSIDTVLAVGAAGFHSGQFTGSDAVLAISQATDNSGDIFIGGRFTSYQTTTVDYIVRLNADGSLN